MKKIILIALVIIAVLGITFAVIWRGMSDYSSVLMANWDFSLPKDANYKEIYSQDSGASFHGDGTRYHIFSYENEEIIEKMFSWEDDEGKTVYHPTYSEAANAWLDEITVPAEYRPNYEGCKYWYNTKNKNDEIIVLWDNSENKIYVLESFF